ncbi:MAG: hypothetical protein ABI467_03505 [Kofleriaceae bacterium]
MRWIVVANLLLGACYAPSAQSGSPCPDGVCPAPLVCSETTQTCETSPGIVEVTVDAQLRDGCTPSPELCGDGIDQDCDGLDPPCVANDEPAGAIDITAGGTFTTNLRYAHDDVAANGCSGDGGRDVFYSINLAAPRVYYFDTFGSSFDTVIRVYARSCATVGSGAMALACQNDACNVQQSQVAVSLPAGPSCVVIDQASSNETTGDVKLAVFAGSRDGMPLPAGTQTLTGNTSTASNVMDPSDTNCDGPGAGGNDLAYFFTVCPAQTLLLDAATCGGASWDTVLYVRDGNTTQIACNDDGNNCDGSRSRITNASISGGTLYWLVVDGFDADSSGAYTLKTNLR